MVPPSRTERVDSSNRLPSRVASLLPWWIRSPLRTVLFWGAIVLPMFYLSLLVVGIETTEGLLLFFGLFGLHVIMLIGGRAHRRVPVPADKRD